MMSIIIPALNEEKYLPLLLKSIKKQNFKNYEIILADAGSKDNTKKIAKKYDCKIVKGGIPSKSRNAGAKAAKGEYLFFLDSDIILPLGYLKRALEEFNEKKLGIAVSQVMPLSKRWIDKFLHNFANFFMKRVESIKPHGGGCCGILTRKELHKKVNGFDETRDFDDDTDYIKRVGKISKFRVLRNCVLFVSVRRLNKEGRLRLASKYIKSTIYQFMGKKVTADKINYEFSYDQDKER